MTATEELRAWLMQHRPAFWSAVLRCTSFESVLNSVNQVSGLSLTAQEYDSDPEGADARVLAALKAMDEPPAPPPGPRKPAPALCVEAHRSEPIDADRARAATLAMCRGA